MDFMLFIMYQILLLVSFLLVASVAGQEEDLHSRILQLHQKLHNNNSEHHKICKRWIVITSIHKVTDSVKAVAELSDWCVVVVGDKKSVPKSTYNIDNVDYIDVAAQKQLDYSIIKLLPYNSYARKNIGYLYAIEHGADVIYETDDDNQLLGDLSGFLSERTELLVYERNTSSSYAVNPYAHFGQPSIWPRGYPLTEITKQDPVRFTKQAVNGWIQQSLANGDPDVDAIFRLTRKTDGEPIDIVFDATAAAVSLPEQLFCPYNSQNTLHHKSAFWALMLPIGVPFRVCDIWRGYWAQRLLWQIGGQLVFLPPFVYQERNAHNYLEDFNDELKMYRETEELLQFLLQWSPQSHSFMEQIKELSKAMQHANFWSEDDVRLTEAWCEDLLRIGYQFPSISPLPPATSTTTYKIHSHDQQSSMMKHLDIVALKKKKKATLFICILAAPGERSLRDTVRATYLSFLSDVVEYRFFTDFRDELTQQNLLEENELYGDLHISTAGVHCPEGQHCTTSFGLVLEALQWTLEHYDFTYFLRLDLDGYLCLPQLLQDLAQRPKKAYMAGNFGCHAGEPDRFFRADGAFVLFTHDLAETFVKQQPLLHSDPSNTFAINFAAFVFELDVVFEHRRWTTNITAICERQVFAHWLKEEAKIHKAHKIALLRVRKGIPITPLQNICENRVQSGKDKVFQKSKFWGERSIDVHRHWPKHEIK